MQECRFSVHCLPVPSSETNGLEMPPLACHCIKEMGIAQAGLEAKLPNWKTEAGDSIRGVEGAVRRWRSWCQSQRVPGNHGRALIFFGSAPVPFPGEAIADERR
jgi:hypothetical protein